MEQLLSRIERKMGRFYISGLMKYIVFGMLGVFVLDMLPLPQMGMASGFLYFNRELILQGQIWRAITFIFIPPSSSLLFIVFALYFYYILGSALENRWGSRRFNLYYLVGILGNILGGFILGFNDNTYLNMSLFLAFACLYPDFEIMLFFFLPVKMKYVAIADAVLLLLQFFRSTGAMKLCMLFSMLPFFLFFWRELYLMIRHWVFVLRRWLNSRR